MEVTKNDRGVLNYNRHLGSDRSGWCNVLVKSDRFSPDDLAAERPIAAERYGQKIANELLEAGVLPEDIVLGFHPPQKRPLTEFVVA